MSTTVWILTRHFDAWESSDIGIFSSAEIAGASALAHAEDIDRVVVRGIAAAIYDQKQNNWLVPETVLQESSDPGHSAGQLWVVQEKAVLESPLLPLNAPSEVEEQLEEAESEAAYWDDRYDDFCDNQVQDWVDDY